MMRMKFKTILLISVVIDICFLFFSQQVGFIHTVFAETESHKEVNTEKQFFSNCRPIIKADDLGAYDDAMGPDGYFYAGLQDGCILRFTGDASNSETFLNTGGRPNCLAFDSKTSNSSILA